MLILFYLVFIKLGISFLLRFCYKGDKSQQYSIIRLIIMRKNRYYMKKENKISVFVKEMISVFQIFHSQLTLFVTSAVLRNLKGNVVKYQ